MIFRETGSNPLTYTLEANYATGLRINTLAPRYDSVNDKRLLKEESPILDTSSTLYKSMKPPIFNIDMFFDIGNSLLISLLDYDGLNPYSRLIKQKGDSLPDAIEKLRKDMKKSDEKPSIGSIKKKLGVGKTKK